jgi:hypothetical protein
MKPAVNDTMQPVQFTCSVSLKTYRKMLYFNTFGINRLQSIFMALAWVAALVLLTLETLQYITPTRIMHFCFLVVTVSIPIIIINLEIKIRKNKNDAYFSKEYTITLSQDGIKYKTYKNVNTERWDDILAVYETRPLFIIYRDKRNIFPIVKTGEPEEKTETARLFFREYLKNRFVCRYSV